MKYNYFVPSGYVEYYRNKFGSGDGRGGHNSNLDTDTVLDDCSCSVMGLPLMWFMYAAVVGLVLWLMLVLVVGCCVYARKYAKKKVAKYKVDMTPGLLSPTGDGRALLGKDRTPL